MVPQFDARTTYDMWQRGEAEILDVRESSEWDLGHIEGVKWIPMGELPARWRELDPGKKLVCVCHSGGRSYYAASALRQAGIDAANLAGGMLDWQAAKLPITPPGIIE